MHLYTHSIMNMVTPRLPFVPCFQVTYVQRPRKQLRFNCVLCEVGAEAGGTAMELIIHHTTVPWLRLLVSSLSPRRSGSILVQSMLDLWQIKWHWDSFFSEHFIFSLSASFHILIFIYMFLPEGQMGEAQEPGEMNCSIEDAVAWHNQVENCRWIKLTLVLLYE